MKSNGGVLVVDDLGRQRCSATELLNRWIVPLEYRVDYLTLSTGKKIQVPFEQIVVFATNLTESDLEDEAFMRRMGYRLARRSPQPRDLHRNLPPLRSLPRPVRRRKHRDAFVAEISGRRPHPQGLRSPRSDRPHHRPLPTPPPARQTHRRRPRPRLERLLRPARHRSQAALTP